MGAISDAMLEGQMDILDPGEMPATTTPEEKAWMAAPSEGSPEARLFRKLYQAQVAMVVPKGQQNTFGGYSYRSCEDIMAMARKSLPAFRLCLYVSDDIKLIGDRYYIEATATVVDTETGARHSVTAYAREALSKKGMDEAQVTGAASSYARKYALAGLFCLDDEADPDTMPPPDKGGQGAKKPLICSQCGKQITPTKGKDGKMISAEDVARATKGKCAVCAKGGQRDAQ